MWTEEGLAGRMKEDKVITIVIPTFNEEDNIKMDYNRIKAVFDEKLLNYDWRILFR